jgi:hypothetical protein
VLWLRREFVFSWGKWWKRRSSWSYFMKGCTDCFIS